MKKIILSLLAIIILVLGGITYYALSNLDAIVKTAIEKVGSDVTGSTVSVAGVSITLKEGRGEISGLHLANPKGFDSAHLFHLDKVALDLGNVFGDVIIIDEVLIDGANIIAEQKGQTTNLQALLDNIEKNSSAPDETKTETKTAEEDNSSEPIRLMIKKFSFINNKASLETEQWDPQVLKVPNIVMTNLGDEKVGLTPEQLSTEVINRLTKSIEKAAKEALKEKAKEEAKKALTEQLDKNLSDKDKAKLDSLKNVFGQ